MRTSFAVFRRPVLPEDEGRHISYGWYATKEEAEAKIAELSGDYFRKSDFYIMMTVPQETKKSLKGRQNRLQIVNWREYGAEESFCEVAIYSNRNKRNLIDDIEKHRQKVHKELTGKRLQPVEEGSELSFYVNDDLLFVDGMTSEYDGKKFRIRIEEIT